MKRATATAAMGTTPLPPGRVIGEVALAGPHPAVLGEYRLLSVLARGGMATVYVGRKEGVAGFERLVAIKVCHPHLREDEEFVSMFLDEARLAARIHHPNVVATLDVHCSEHLYLVMDYVEGGSLAELLRGARRGSIRLPAEVVVRTMVDTLAGLHAAHELRDADGQWMALVHRDVSPQNVLVGVDGIARITDFGIAFAAARSTVTRAGRLKGKLSYMSPEQVRGQPVTRRSDVFAAGTVLWEALTGRPLFRRGEEAATINAVLSEDIAAPSSIEPSVSPALDAVVLRALDRDPDGRFATAAEFADALEHLPLPRAAAREVAQSMEEALGPVVQERRDAVRRASDGGPRTLTPIGETSDGSGSGDEESTLRVDHGTLVRLAHDSVAPEAGAKDLELRRMRMLLAAVMLLLVGSALGVLLTRSASDPKPAPAPAASAPAEPAR